MNWTNMLREFHKGCYTADPVTPTIPPQEKIDLRMKLIEEEFYELMSELQLSPPYTDIERIAKECADLIYVVIGTSLAYGIPMERVFAEVHRSNMSKFVDGHIVKREDGKVLKGPNYKPADMGIIWEGIEDERISNIHENQK